MQYMMTKRIYEKEDLKEGDLVFFSIHTKRISHVGVYLGNGMFVHASSSRGVMISDLDQAYWTRFYAGAGRY
ncbi:Peptidoglycan endopeptidase LytF precursor [compost metagenome]